MPVTVTARLNVSRTSICSLRPYVLPLAGVLAIAASLTADAVNVPPATLWLPLFSMALAPRSSSASVVPPATSIVPLFNPSASAPMLSPSVSASPDTTT